ncbi:MAG: hypothetical protein AAB458_03080 [Patescibacteria group bacterium]
MLRATKPKENTMSWMTKDWTQGELNALVKKIGGEEVARGVLNDSLLFKIEKSTVPPLLDVIGTHLVLATTSPIFGIEKFKLKKDGGICSYLGDNFRSWFLGKTEDPKSETTLRSARLTRNSPDKPILETLGDKAETSLAEMFAMMEVQADGKGGNLLVNGYANIFYVKDSTGMLRAVYAHWFGVGWGVHAGSVGGPSGWRDGGRVFSRNS